MGDAGGVEGTGAELGAALETAGGLSLAGTLGAAGSGAGAGGASWAAANRGGSVRAKSHAATVVLRIMRFSNFLLGRAG